MNVYEAAKQRIRFALRNTERAYISFSGGKDSGVMLNLVMEVAKQINYKNKIGLLLVDLEAQYSSTVEYAENEYRKHWEMIEPYWVSLPLNLRNAVSSYEPFWCAFDPNCVEAWVRNPPDFAVRDETIFPFYKHRMEFEEFTPAFGDWYASGKSTACFVGIRTQESLNRWRSIHNMPKKKRLADKSWTTLVGKNVFNIYPIFDWVTEDIWTANSTFNWGYNPIYDLMHKAGVGIHQQRICQPYGDDQRIGLNLYRELEPPTWAKLVGRVSGANFGNIYCGSKALGFKKVDLPNGMTWRQYTLHLLATLPKETARNYRARFSKFLWHWRKYGSPTDLDVSGLPTASAIEPKTKRKIGDGKRVVTYRRCFDALPGKFETKRAAPTWRRLAMAIIRNDHLCKSLGFTQTTRQHQNIVNALQRYKDL